MSEWKECKLGDLINEGVAKLQTGPFGTMLNASEYVSNGTPVIAVQDIADNKLLHHKFVYVDDKTALRLSRYCVKENDIIFGRKGAVERRAIIKKSEEGWLQGSDCIRLRFSELIYPQFISYQFGSNTYKEWMAQNSTGATMPSLNQEVLKQLPIRLPLLPEQKAIATVLSSIDDKIDLLHRQNATLEAMTETLFRQWFVEEAKEDWEDKPLSFFGNIVCGKTPPKAVKEYFNGNILFIKIPDMHGKTFIFQTDDSLTEQGRNFQLNKTLPPKSICISCIATVGLVSMNAFEAQTNQQINSIIPNKDIYKYYLFLHLKSLYDLLHAMASGGTATLNLNTGNFSQILVPLPSKENLTEFHKTIEPLFEKIFKNQTQIRTLTTLRDTLLPKLMSGEVRVKM